MTPDQIRAIRRFNRFHSRAIGTLDESYLRRGRPLAEARLLHEIASCADIHTLRARLGLDSGYMSRLLRALEKQGLVDVRQDDRDGRRRAVKLTRRGQGENCAYDRLSDALAVSFGKGLTDTEKQRLVTALEEARRLMLKAALEIVPVDVESNEAQHCLAAYYAELAKRFAEGFNPQQKSYAGADKQERPASFFLVARGGGEALACAQLLWDKTGIGEIKRMWVAGEARGLGIARRMLQALEEEARRLGLQALRLDTNRALPEAAALYRAAGYEAIARYSDNPYAHLWFGKALSPSLTRGA